MSTRSKGVMTVLRTIPATTPARMVANNWLFWNVSSLFKLSFARAKEVNWEVPMKALGREAVAPLKNPRIWGRYNINHLEIGTKLDTEGR